jgi:hypothetical protein
MVMGQQRIVAIVIATVLALGPCVGAGLAQGRVINLTPIETSPTYGSSYGSSVYSPTRSPSVTQPQGGYTSQPTYGAFTPPNQALPSVNTAYGQTSGMTPLKGRLSTIPQGTLMMIRMDQPINSASSRVGDPVVGVLESDLYVNDTVAAPAGTQVNGQVVSVDPAGRMGRHGQIEVRFMSLKTPDGVILPIRSHMVTHDDTGILRGNTYAMDIAKGVGWAAGSTAVGAVAGTAVGGLLSAAGAGAVFGTGVGAVGGIGYALMRTGKDVVLPSGTRLSIINDQPISINTASY